ncbi:uncharacterized protein BJ212DRAFT_1324837, partial [Suillus subaureus]
TVPLVIATETSDLRVCHCSLDCMVCIQTRSCYGVNIYAPAYPMPTFFPSMYTN